MNEMIGGLNAIGERFVEFSFSMLVQSGVLIAVLFTLDLILRKRVRAVFRYYLWILVLVKLMLPTTLTFPTGVGYWVGDKIAAKPVTVMMAGQIEEKNLMGQGPSYVSLENQPASEAPRKAIQPVPIPAVTVVKSTPVTWATVLFLGWALAIIVMVLLMVQRYFFVRGLIAQAGPAEDKLTALFQDCGRQMEMAKLPVIKISPAMVSPAACGLVNPVILMPEFLPSKLTDQEMRGVLIHELAHIRRGDLWVNLFQTILQIAYFYNPLLWLANAMIRRVREQAVDEITLVGILDLKKEKTDIGNVYAQTLVNVAKVATLRPALSLRMIGVVESKSALAGRIKHILTRPIPKTAKLGFLGLAGIFFFGALLLPMACEKGKKKSPLPIEIVNPTSKTTLMNGTTVELVGLSEYPSTGKKWWRPNGTLLETVPSLKQSGGIKIEKDRKGIEIIFKIKGPPGIDYAWRIDQSNGGGSESRDGLLGIIVDLPQPLKSTDIHLGVATKEWKTIGQSEGKGLQSSDGLFFTEAYEKGTHTTINVAHNLKETNYRIIAIDMEGKIHTGGSSSGSNGNMTQSTAQFYKLPLKQIKEFQFQTRPYEWVTFKDVSLEPGEITKAQVETNSGIIPSEKKVGTAKPATPSSNIEHSTSIPIRRQAIEHRTKEKTMGQGPSYITKHIRCPILDFGTDTLFLFDLAQEKIYEIKSNLKKRTWNENQDLFFQQIIQKNNGDFLFHDKNGITMIRSARIAILHCKTIQDAAQIGPIPLAAYIRAVDTEHKLKIPMFRERHIEPGEIYAVLTGKGLVALIQIVHYDTPKREMEIAYLTLGSIDMEKPPKTAWLTNEAAIYAAETWLNLVDEGKYSESWNRAANFFQKAVPLANWETAIKGVRPALGKVLSRKFLSNEYTTSLPGAPDGEYVVIQFQMSFENKKAAVETITPMKEKDGTWKVAGYYIK